MNEAELSERIAKSAEAVADDVGKYIAHCLNAQLVSVAGIQVLSAITITLRSQNVTCQIDATVQLVDGNGNWLKIDTALIVARYKFSLEPACWECVNFDGITQQICTAAARFRKALPKNKSELH